MRLIDADALKKHYSWWNDGYKEIFDNIIDQQPTIEERKKGKWIKDRHLSTNTSFGGTYGVRGCSECESYYQDVGYGWNFCPNCGADMRERT